MAALQRIPEFLERLGEIAPDDRDRSWSIALNEVKHLKTAEWIPAGENKPVRGYATSTVRSVLSDYRNAVRERFGDEHPVLEFLRPSHADQRNVRESVRETIQEQIGEIRGVSAEALVDRATRIISEPRGQNAFALAASIALLTGRRPIEVLKTGEFDRVDANAPRDALFPSPDVQSLSFGGQAKGKSGEIVPAYRIPVLADPDRIAAAVDELREVYDVSGLSNEQVSGRTSKTLGQNVRQLFFDDTGEPLSPKDLRGVYAVLAFESFAREGGEITYNEFTGRVLGHNANEGTTALSYQRFAPSDEVGAYNRIFRDANAISEAQLRGEAELESDSTKKGYLMERAAQFREAVEASLERSGDREPAVEPGSVAPAAASQVSAVDPPAAQALEASAARAASLAAELGPRNSFELVGSVKSIRTGTPTLVDVVVENGAFKDTLRVSSFRDVAKTAASFEPGQRIVIDGYVASRDVTVGGQKRSIGSLTANAVRAAGDDDRDRNVARVAGNVSLSPIARDGEKGPFAALSLVVGNGKYVDAIAYGNVAERVRDEVGRGDAVSLSGRLRFSEGRSGFPASVTIVASDVAIERKKEPELELSGTLVRDARVSSGPKATRVDFTIVGDGEASLPQRVIAFADKGATWPDGLKKDSKVAVVGKSVSEDYVKDGQTRTSTYLKASRVDVVARAVEVDSPAESLGDLPVYRPDPNEQVDRREDFSLEIPQTMTVLGKSEDGKRVLGRNGAAVLSVAGEAFEVAPKVDEAVTIEKVDGRERALPCARELSLGR